MTFRLVRHLNSAPWFVTLRSEQLEVNSRNVADVHVYDWPT